MMTHWKRLLTEKENESHISGEYMILPAALEDGKIPIKAKTFSYLISGLILALIIWAAVAHIQELATAHGKVVPSGSVKLVHHLEGGQIQKIFVQEGQIIEEGHMLVTLRPEATSSDLNQLKVRGAHLALQIIRYSALIDGVKPDFGPLEGQYPDLAEGQNKVFKNELSHMAKSERTLRAKVEQRQVELYALGREHESLNRQVEIQSEQLKIRETLLESGYTSRRAYLDSKSGLESAKTSAISVKGRIETTKKQLDEAISQLLEVKAQGKRGLSEERSKLEGELAELKQTMTKHQDRFNRLAVKAPVSGIIQEIIPKTVGEVIRPGDLVAKIVPLDKEIVAEVELNPQDIGHVKIGDPAEVKISTYDPNVFGIIKGSVQSLSPTTFQKEGTGETYYKAIIKLEKNHVIGANIKHLILPGMLVQADIITGAKSLIKYLFKPVFRSLSTAFSER